MVTRARGRKRRRTSWIMVVLVAVAAAAGGYVYYARATEAAAEPKEPPMQTATVRRSDIVVTALGSGNLMAGVELSLAFRSGGTLVEVPVAVGSAVDAGQVLARLDDTSARLQVSQAELNLAQAESKLALAQAAVSQTLEIAEANLAAAQAAHDALLLNAGHSGDRLTASRVSLEQAREELVAAQAAYNTAWDPGRDWELSVQKTAAALENERAATTRALDRAKDALEIASAAYTLAKAGLEDDSALQSAWAKVLAARRDVEGARAGTAVQETAWSVQQAELSLASAQLSLDNTTLRAPTGGTITAIEVGPGETVGTAPVLTLIAEDMPLVRFYLEESDLAYAAPGHRTTIVFDALPNRTFAGEVMRIDPTLATVDGTPAVQVWASVELDEGQVMPTGLTAEVEVVAGEAYKTLVVPVQALRELAPGQFAVFVVEADGALKLRPVEVGLRDFANAEILSGLAQGDVVSTGTVGTE